jgi:hypothetical protein
MKKIKIINKIINYLLILKRVKLFKAKLMNMMMKIWKKLKIYKNN